MASMCVWVWVKFKLRRGTLVFVLVSIYPGNPFRVSIFLGRSQPSLSLFSLVFCGSFHLTH